MAFNEKYVADTATGGGTGTLADPWTWDEAVTNVVAGDRVNVKAGTYTCVNDSSVNGTSSSPIHIRGYQTTPGDLDSQPLGTLVAGTDIPKVTATSGSYRGFNGQYLTFSHISFHNSLNFQTAWRLNQKSKAISCRFVCEGTVSYHSVTGSNCTLYDCYLETVSSAAVALLAENSSVIQCIVVGKGNASSGIRGGDAYGCIFKDFSGNGNAFYIEYSRLNTISNCTFINCTTAIRETVTYANPVNIYACYFDTCTTAIKNNGTAGNWLVSSCCYRNVATELDGVESQIDRREDTSEKFVDSANNDFTLQPSSAGYALRSPKVVAEFGTTHGSDIGALQHANPQLSTGYIPTAGIQLFPFRQWVEDDFGVEIKGSVFHPLG